MVNEGHEQGVLLESEAEMLHNIFEFGDKEAKDIMTHRKSIEALDGNKSYYDAVAYITETGRSRLPVYVEDIDNIIGVLHIKDALSFAQKNEVFRTPIKDIPDLIRDVNFITETININVLFKQMQMDKNHMCIVIDEYGQMAGIVTMEDILEEIVGNIMDEYDEEDDSIIKESEDTYLIKGMTPLSAIEDVVGVSFAEEEFETLNGYLISKLERIPDEEEDEAIIIDTDKGQFKVLSVEGNMIAEVRLIMLKEETEEVEDDN
jgi:putative hemolysin